MLDLIELIVKLIILGTFLLCLMFLYSAYFEYQGDKEYYIANWNNAIDKYSEALRFEEVFFEVQPFSNKTLVSLYFRRGNAYFELGDYRNAIRDYNQAIELDKIIYRENDRLFLNRGNAYLNLGEYENAINDYTIVINLDPKNITAYRNRSLSLMDGTTEHCQIAQSDVEHYLDLTPSTTEDSIYLINRLTRLCGIPAN